MRPPLVLAILAGSAAVSAQPVVERQAPEISERPNHVSFGVITVDAPPAEVYSVVTSYAAWKTFFRDVVSLRVLDGGPEDAVIRVKTRSLGREATLKFDNIPDRSVRFRLIDGPPGARAHGEYQLVPVDDGTRTRIEATLYMDVVGAPGLFISDRKTRGMRRAKLRADLEDASAWFAHPRHAAQR